MLRVSARTAAVTDPPVALAKRWVAHRTFAPDFPLLDVSQAVPGDPPPGELRAHIADLALHRDTGRYAPGLGLPSTRDAVAGHLAPSNVTADHVMITSGCNQAFCLAIGALCDPGDEVVLPTPFYFNHDMWLRANGVVPVYVAADPTAGMLPPIDTIASSITNRTRAIVFVSPNNPCGVVYPPEFIEAGYELAAEHGIAFVLDETYKDFRTTTAPAHRLFERPDWDTTLLQLFSFSKVFSLAGYRVGSLAAAPHVLAEALKLADCETIGAPRIAQEAVAFGLEHLRSWVETNRVAMTERVDTFRAEMSTVDGYTLTSAGAFFAYLHHPFIGVDSTTVAKRLADDFNLLTIPGSCFGPGQDGYLRLAFGNVHTAELAVVADRLQRSVRS